MTFCPYHMQKQGGDVLLTSTISAFYLKLMATPSFIHSPQPSSFPDSSIKELISSGVLASSVPSRYASRDLEEPAEAEHAVEGDIPVIDFSLLTGGTLEQRSQVVRDLGRACREWGFFMVVNHSVPEELRETVVRAVEEFFNLTDEEKRENTGKRVLDPIRFGTSFNSTVEEVCYWRDFLKIIVHPEFNSPSKPIGFRDIVEEYTASTRQLMRDLLKGIWESLELEIASMDEALNLDSCFQIFVGNLYPPCPQPELALGLPPHSDYGLLTLLFQNGYIDGLQVKHDGRWVHVKPLPNSFLVNTGDHMEIASNGRYKSVLHRAVLNSKSTRMSIVTLIGPSLDVVVIPAPELVSREEDHRARYRDMKFKDYVEYQQGNQLKEKSVLDLLRLPKE